MQLGLKEPLPTLVKARFTTAKASQALIFSDTSLAILHTRDGTPFQLRYCPALAKKPKANNGAPAHPSGPKPDPFANPGPDLLLAEIPRHNPTHVLVLNKYPVIPLHFILATKTDKPQTHMLEPDDLVAAHACMREWEASAGGGERVFAFFNSGAHSGASQAHRHLQFLPVEEMRRGEDGGGGGGWDPLVDLLLAAPDRTRADLPLACFAEPLPEAPTADQLVAAYRSLYDSAAKAVRAYVDRGEGDLALHPSEGGDSSISYNLAMTTSGMAILPRRSEDVTLRDEGGREIGSVALNGTILAGTLMVKAEEEWELLQKDARQLEHVLGGIGIPVNYGDGYGRL